MARIKWYLKQLFPLTYRSKYREEGIMYFAVWKMWLGRCYNHDRYAIQGGK